MTLLSATWNAINDVKNAATTLIKQSYLAVMDDDETMSNRTMHSLGTYTHSAIHSIGLFARSLWPHSPQTLPPFHTPSSLQAACEQLLHGMNRETIAMLENFQQRTCHACVHDPAVPSTLNAIQNPHKQKKHSVVFQSSFFLYV